MFKKVFLAALALIGSVSLANAQEVFHKGTTAINAGVGLGSYYSGLALPPLSVSLDYGVTGNMINGNNGVYLCRGLPWLHRYEEVLR